MPFLRCAEALGMSGVLNVPVRRCAANTTCIDAAVIMMFGAAGVPTAAKEDEPVNAVGEP